MTQLARIPALFGEIEQIDLGPDIRSRIDDLLEQARELPRVNGPEDVPGADKLSGELAKLARDLETARKEAKAEPLRIGRMIDDAVAPQIENLQAVRKRIDGQIVLVKQAEERQRLEAERDRQRIEREAAEREAKLQAERDRVAREQAERTRAIAEVAVEAKTDEDRQAVVEMLTEANEADEVSKAALATLAAETRQASGKAWVAALDAAPATVTKARVHAREKRVAVLVDPAKSPSHVNGVCLVSKWDTTTARKLLESGIVIEGWELRTELTSVRR